MTHPSNQCHIVTEVGARKSILLQKKKCFNCLRVGYLVKSYYKESKCFTCGGKHHISICEKRAIQNRSNRNSIDQNNSKDQSIQNKQPHDHKGTATPGSTALLINNNNGNTLYACKQLKLGFHLRKSQIKH